MNAKSMNQADSTLESEIRNWLVLNLVQENTGLEVYDVPESLFNRLIDEERLQQLNSQIRGLPLQQQKLLRYLSRDLDPAIIIESMEYASPELFWLDKALLVKEIDPSARQHDVLQVFAANEHLVDEIIRISDLMDREKEKAKSKKYRKWIVIAAPVVVLLSVLVLYPLLFKPDPVALFDRYSGSFLPDTAAVDTTSLSGAAYLEALILMEDGDYAESGRIFQELIPADTLYRIPSRWFLALIELRSGDFMSCKEQLTAIRSEEPDFFRKYAAGLFGKLQAISR